MENAAAQSTWSRVIGYLPEGRALQESTWRARHRFVLGFLWAHAVGLTIFGLAQGWDPAYAIGEGALIGLITLVAAYPKLGRKFRSTAAALGAVTSSAVLTQFWGGYIEAHFHYFVVVALIATYQDWVPFGLAIGFVAFDHGLIGSLMPTWVYNHPAAIANPWGWALVHAVLVLAECAILVAWWKANERDRAQTDLVLRSASEGILGVDENGKVTFANPAAATLLGMPASSIVGQPLGGALRGATPAGGQDPVVSFQVAPLAGATSAAGNLWIQQERGRIPVDWTMNPIRENGMNRGSVVTLVDASQRQRAEDERAKRLRQVNDLERLEAQDKFKTLFINTAAHELHTPLTPLRLNLFALKEGHRGVLNADQLDAVTVLDRNVERLSHLVEDVLNAARLQANRMSLEKTQVNLAELSHGVVDSFQEQAHANEVTIDTRLEPGVFALADKRRLDQVLMNLLANAVKFTPSGGRITVSTGKENGAAYLRVKDTGIGLRAEDLNKLFQPFSQAHNPMEQTKVGSGLGLYICRGIMELHGGRIEAFSGGAGKGCTFTAYIPLQEMSDGSAGREPNTVDVRAA
jgi:PAS domain S-box-containing protein